MNLNQVTVPSTDMRRSIDFYRRLGLVLIVEDLPSYARFECPEGDATFSVHQTGQPGGSPGWLFISSATTWMRPWHG